MMKKFMKKLWDKKDSKKGFTLVELIVVLVILAILAAIMVPALLGWIDKAREKQYVLEARNVYMGIQAQASEAYAIGKKTKFTKTDVDIAELEKVTEVSNVTVETLDTESTTDNEKGAFTIKSLKITFPDGSNTITAELPGNGQAWIITVAPTT